MFWLSTVRPDGRPHVTPLLAVWCADAMYFCTGSDERKAKNLKRNPHCILTTGRNTLDESLDVVVEGQVAKVSDGAELEQVANTYESKYGTHLTAPGGTWFGLGDTIRSGEVLVYRVTLRRYLASPGVSSSVRPDGISSDRLRGASMGLPESPWNVPGGAHSISELGWEVAPDAAFWARAANATRFGFSSFDARLRGRRQADRIALALSFGRSRAPRRGRRWPPSCRGA